MLLLPSALLEVLVVRRLKLINLQPPIRLQHTRVYVSLRLVFEGGLRALSEGVQRRYLSLLLSHQARHGRACRALISQRRLRMLAGDTQPVRTLALASIACL